MILQVAARPVLSRQAVKPQALFGFGKKDAAADKAAAPQYYICEYLPVIQLILYGSNGCFNTAICSGITATMAATRFQYCDLQWNCQSITPVMHRFHNGMLHCAYQCHS